MDSVVRDAASIVGKVCLTKSGVVGLLSSIANIRYADDELTSRHKFLLSLLVSAEKILPGGAEALLSLLSENNPDIHECHTRAFSATHEGLLNALKKYEGCVGQICLEALNLAGPTGTVAVFPTTSQEAWVELKLGSEFSVKSPLGNVPSSSRRIVLVDGYIESVSELHRVLEQASADKQKFLIISRVAADEVASTLRVNNMRGTFDGIICCIPMDENTVNSLRDISLVTGASVLTSDMGSLISSCDLTTAPEVKCEVLDGRLVVYHNVDVSRHVSKLLDKSESVNEITGKLLAQRARNLSTRRVFIGIPDDIRYFSVRSQVDECLREASHYFKFGEFSKLEARLAVSHLAKAYRSVGYTI